MHVQVMVRGIRPLVEMWLNAADNEFFKWERTNQKTKKTTYTLLKSGIRPSVLGTWEIIIPETALPTLLSMMMLDRKNIGAHPTFMNKIRLATLRKMCGVKKIPKKIWEEAKKIMPSIIITKSERGLSSLYVPGVAVHLIGYKKDKYGIMNDPNEKDTFYQELI